VVDIYIALEGIDGTGKSSISEKLADKLKKFHKIYKLYIFPNGDHGIINNYKERDDIIFKWFEKYVKK